MHPLHSSANNFSKGDVPFKLPRSFKRNQKPQLLKMNCIERNLLFLIFLTITVHSIDILNLYNLQVTQLILGYGLLCGVSLTMNA